MVPGTQHRVDSTLGAGNTKIYSSHFPSPEKSDKASQRGRRRVAKKTRYAWAPHPSFNFPVNGWQNHYSHFQPRPILPGPLPAPLATGARQGIVLWSADFWKNMSAIVLRSVYFQRTCWQSENHTVWRQWLSDYDDRCSFLPDRKFV